MPHTTSAKKNLRKAEKRRLANRAVVKAIKTQLKKFDTTADEGTVEQLDKEFRLAVKKLDKAASRKVIHRNLASRKKSQLARKLHAKKTTPKAAPAAKTTKS